MHSFEVLSYGIEPNSASCINLPAQFICLNEIQTSFSYLHREPHYLFMYQSYTSFLIKMVDSRLNSIGKKTNFSAYMNEHNVLEATASNCATMTHSSLFWPYGRKDTDNDL